MKRCVAFPVALIVMILSCSGQALAADNSIAPKRVPYAEAISDPQWKGIFVYAWEGEHIVFLTAGDQLDRKVMSRFVTDLDKAWEWMADMTGFKPYPAGGASEAGQPHFIHHYNGKASLNVTMSWLEVAGPGKEKPDSRINYDNFHLSNFDDFEYEKLRKDPAAITPRHILDIAGCFKDPKRRIPNLFSFDVSMAVIYEQHAKLKPYLERDVYMVTHFGKWQSAIAKSEHDWESLYFSHVSFKRASLPYVPPISDKTWMSKLATGSIVAHLYKQHGEGFVRRFYHEIHALPKMDYRIGDNKRIQLVAMAAAASIAAKRDLSRQFVRAWKFPLSKADLNAIGKLKLKEDGASASALITDLYPEVLEKPRNAAPPKSQLVPPTPQGGRTDQPEFKLFPKEKDGKDEKYKSRR